MLLEVKNIRINFKKETQKKIFGKERQEIIKGVSFFLEEGDCLGIIGESGSGKSTLGKSLVGLLPPNEGEIFLEGINLYGKKTRQEKEQLNHLKSVVFQDYISSVNSRFKVKDIINESLKILEKKESQKFDKKNKTLELLQSVGLNETFLERYPHELSGGQLQRVCIARAIATKPKFILLDEAVSSLDASIQTQVMNLLKELQKKFNFTYIFITHDLPSVTYMCNKVIFFNEGKIVEQVDSIYRLSNVETEYAQNLLNSILEIDIYENQ